jgi:2-polyprenyl-6-methoxyphenol hydroxylase-like FAD-dependent oxidoreductase
VTDQDQVIIVGGGIAGLATALMLAHTGFQVRVLERAGEFTEVGAGLQLAPNATRVLAEYGVLDSVLERAILPGRLVARSAVTGQQLTVLDLEHTRRRYGYPYLVMHRSDLLDVLVQRCRSEPRIVLSAESDVTSVEDAGTGVVVTTRDATYRGGILLGADGLHSTVRPLIVTDEPICSGYVAYRGAVPIDTVDRRVELDEVVAWMGPGLHLVQYPVRGAKLYNQVAVFRSEEFQRGNPDWGAPEELDKVFSVTCEPVQAALPSLMRNRRWPMFDRLPAPRWTRGRITLLGDAAHPMLQYLAQGACQAIQDGAALARVLAPLAGEGAPATGDVEQALRAYEQQRLGQASRVQRTARVWGDIWHVDGLAMALRDEAFRLRHPEDFSHIDWLYGNQAA